MLTLRKLRGEPMATVPLLGRTLTLYRQGTQRGMALGLGTLAVSSLLWRWLPDIGQLSLAILAMTGFYLSAALMASHTPAMLDAEKAAGRWL